VLILLIMLIYSLGAGSLLTRLWKYSPAVPEPGTRSFGEAKSCGIRKRSPYLWR